MLKIEPQKAYTKIRPKYTKILPNMAPGSFGSKIGSKPNRHGLLETLLGGVPKC